MYSFFIICQLYFTKHDLVTGLVQLFLYLFLVASSSAATCTNGGHVGACFYTQNDRHVPQQKAMPCLRMMTMDCFGDVWRCVKRNAFVCSHSAELTSCCLGRM